MENQNCENVSHAEMTENNFWNHIDLRTWDGTITREEHGNTWKTRDRGNDHKDQNEVGMKSGGFQTGLLFLFSEKRKWKWWREFSNKNVNPQFSWHKPLAQDIKLKNKKQRGVINAAGNAYSISHKKYGAGSDEEDNLLKSNCFAVPPMVAYRDGHMRCDACLSLVELAQHRSWFGSCLLSCQHWRETGNRNRGL